MRYIIGILIVLTGTSYGQAPFVDGPFNPISADNDPNLIIVRERFDAEKNTQSIYIRMFDGTPD